MVVSVWKIEDETQRILLQNVLKDEEIESELRSAQIPWMDGIMKSARGYWGDLMVLEKDADQARKIIEDYLGEKFSGVG